MSAQSAMAGAMPKRSTRLFCQRADDGTYCHFAPHPIVVRMYGSKREIFGATVIEAADETSGYWAWWDNERAEFMFVYPHRSLVEMCFTYGSAIEEKHGRGLLLPVTIVPD